MNIHNYSNQSFWIICLCVSFAQVIITRITRTERLPIRRRSWLPMTPSPSTRAVWNVWAGRRATNPTTDGGSKIEATESCGNSSAIFFTIPNTVPAWSAGRTSTTAFSASFRARSWPTCGAPSRTIRAWRTKNLAGQWGNKTHQRKKREIRTPTFKIGIFSLFKGTTTKAKCSCPCWAAVWCTNSALTPSSGSRIIQTSSSPSVWTGKHDASAPSDGERINSHKSVVRFLRDNCRLWSSFCTSELCRRQMDCEL